MTAAESSPGPPHRSNEPYASGPCAPVSPAARQLTLVYYPSALATRTPCGCRDRVGGSNSPYWAADLTPARILQSIYAIEQKLINGNVFRPLQVLKRITPRMSASVYECVRFTWPKGRLLGQTAQKHFEDLLIQVVNDWGLTSRIWRPKLR